MKVAIIGTTSWGTTLGMMLSRRGVETSLWARTDEEAASLMRSGESPLLPGIPFPPGLSSTGSMEEATRGASLVILAVPAQTMRENTRLAKEYLDSSMLIMSASKGLEAESARRMSQVIADEIRPQLHPNICVLSGPNLSKEIARGFPASAVIAACSQDTAERAGEIMDSPIYRVYTSSDVVGVELGGALKNIVALGAGMIDGLGYGNNAKAAFISRGFEEMTHLGVAAGAQWSTFLGLSGLGDLIATCSSPLSRNHTLGEGIAQGRPLDEALASIAGVVEGVPTTTATLKMAGELGIEMPVTERIYRVLFEGLNAHQLMAEIMWEELTTDRIKPGP